MVRAGLVKDCPVTHVRNARGWVRNERGLASIRLRGWLPDERRSTARLILLLALRLRNRDAARNFRWIAGRKSLLQLSVQLFVKFPLFALLTRLFGLRHWIISVLKLL